MVRTGARLRNLPVICGILAPLLFAGTDIFTGTLWEGYSFSSQSISELSAVGGPTRSVVVPLNFTYNALMVTFGLAVWGLAHQKRAPRIMASLIIGNAITALVMVAFFPMHPGEAVNTLANTTNIILGAVSMLFFLLAMGFGAATYHNWFRFLSIGILLTFLVLTILGLLRPQMIQGQPVSLVGLQERTIAYGCLLWVLVLAVALLRAPRTENT